MERTFNIPDELFVVCHGFITSGVFDDDLPYQCNQETYFKDKQTAQEFYNSLPEEGAVEYVAFDPSPDYGYGYELSSYKYIESYGQTETNYINRTYKDLPEIGPWILQFEVNKINL
jgi:hypothetical protein